MGLELDKNDGEFDGNNNDAVENFEYVNRIKNVRMPEKPKLNKILIVDD